METRYCCFMRRAFFLLILPLVATLIAPSASSQTGQAPATTSQQRPPDLANVGPMALQVRSEFLYSWNAYKQYAWGHDELKPLSKGAHDWYGSSLYMTPVDALDTMILMGLTDEANKTRDFIAQNLSFDHDIEVKNF